jgi:putative endonuclease
VSSKPAVYVLLCRDGTLYTGATVDLPRRMQAHLSGKAAKYTRARLPVRLFAWWHPASFGAARSQEARFKRLRRSAKLVALRGREVFGCRVFAQAKVRDAVP